MEGGVADRNSVPARFLQNEIVRGISAPLFYLLLDTTYTWKREQEGIKAPGLLL